MELRQLRYVLAVADELHFGRAAERAQAAQSVVSEQIRRLERELGTELFDRTSRYVRLTEAGRLFVAEVRSTLEQLEGAAVLAGRAAHGEFGELRIGFVATGAGDLTASIMRSFRARMPNVELVFRDAGMRDPEGGLGDGSADAAFVHRWPDQRLSHEHVVLEVMPTMLAVPATHPFANREAVAYAEINPGLVVMSQPVAPPREWSLSGQTVDSPPVPRTIAEGLEYVALGALAILPISVARRYGRAGVTMVRLTGGPQVEVAIAWRDNAMRRVVDSLVECARSVAAERSEVRAVS